MSNIAKNFDIIATSILHSYFDNDNKIIFKSVFSKIFKYSNKIILCTYYYYYLYVHIIIIYK